MSIEDIWPILEKSGICNCNGQDEINSHENLLHTTRSVHFDCLDFGNEIICRDVSISVTRNGHIEIEFFGDIEMPSSEATHIPTKIQDLESILHEQFMIIWQLR